MVYNIILCHSSFSEGSLVNYYGRPDKRQYTHLTWCEQSKLKIVGMTGTGSDEVKCRSHMIC